MRLRKSSLYALFIVILLSTEFYYIEAFGGAMRVYHLLVPLVIISLWKYVPTIAKTGAFWALIGFLSANVLAASLANSPGDSFRRLGLLAANMSIAFAMALILVTGRLKVEQVFRIMLGVAIAGIVFGIVQIAAFKLAGINLGLSESQQIQVAGGFSSGFRTEANSFAKNLNVILLLLLPTLLDSRNWRRSVLITTLILIGMLASLTRSALYGLSVTLMLAYFWYQLSGRGRIFASRPLIVIAIAAIGIFTFTAVVGQFNEYAARKLAMLFDSDEILSGSSSGFRLISQQHLWDAFLTSDKTILFGNGWGEVRFFIGDTEYQAFGAEIIMALCNAGVLGGFFYILYQLVALNAARRATAKAGRTKQSLLAEGVMFAILGVLITGQINGALLAPEYWMLFGLAIYYTLASRPAVKSSRVVNSQPKVGKY